MTPRELRNVDIFFGASRTPRARLGHATSVFADKAETPRQMRNRQLLPAPRRNDRCPCGSGKKYKVCCMRKGVL